MSDRDGMNRRMDLEAAARERRYGLSGDRVRAVFQSLHDIGWMEPQFPAMTALDLAMEHCAPDSALRLFESMPLLQLREKSQVMHYLNLPEVPFYTIDQLSVLLDEFAAHQQRGKGHLLHTGVPNESFEKSRWLESVVSRLYTLKMPYMYPVRNLRGGMRDALDGLMEATLNSQGNYEYPIRWFRRPGNGVALEERNSETTIIWPQDGQFDGEIEPMLSTGAWDDDMKSNSCGYDEAEYFDVFDRDEALMVEALRGRLFSTKVSLLQTLAVALRRGCADSLWAEALSVLVGELSADECILLQKTEELSSHTAPDVASALAACGHSDCSARGPAQPGGLKSMFDLIGHCMKELTMGTMASACGEMLRLLGRIPESYYQASEKEREDLDPILDRFVALESRSQVFWDGYSDRVTQALSDEFRDRVVHTTMVSRAIAPVYSAQVHCYGDYVRGVLESGGSLQLSLGGSHQNAAEPVNAITRHGQGWTIHYRSKKTMVKHYKGISHLAHLLTAEPDKIFTALELERAESGLPRGVTEGTAEEYGLLYIDELRKGMKPDAQALKEMRQHLSVLNDDIDEAERDNDPEKAAKLQEDKNHIVDWISEHPKLIRESLGPLDQAAKRVSKNIQLAIDRIEDHDRELGRHLRNTIHTGRTPRYSPSMETPRWQR